MTTNLDSGEGVLLNDPGVDILHVRLDDVLVHVVDGLDQAGQQPSLLLHRGVVVKPEEVPLLVLEQLVLFATDQRS